MAFRLAGIALAVTALLSPTAAVAGSSSGRPPAVSVTEYALPAEAEGPFGIAAGPHRSVWFGAGNYLGQVTKGGRVVTYQVPTPNANVGWVTRGPNGAIWFAERDGNRIGRIESRGRIREIALPTPDSVPQTIVFDRRGRLWYTASEVNKLGRINRNGSIDEFTVPTPDALPLGMVLGPDNALWITERSAERIARFDLRTETFTEFPLAPGANPQRIVLGHDGALWFSEASPSRIGRITTGGKVTEYPVPSQPVGIGADERGIWYAGYNTSRIGRVGYDGSLVAEYQVPTPDSRPIQLAVVSKRASTEVWFTEQGANKVGRLQVADSR